MNVYELIYFSKYSTTYLLILSVHTLLRYEKIAVFVCTDTIQYYTIVCAMPLRDFVPLGQRDVYKKKNVFVQKRLGTLKCNSITAGKSKLENGYAVPRIGKMGFNALRKVLFQIERCIPHRLFRDDTFRLNRSFATRKRP